MTFDEWYRGRFGHNFQGLSDEDCDLEFCWQAATLAEREECAKTAEVEAINGAQSWSHPRLLVAKAIRARGDKEGV